MRRNPRLDDGLASFTNPDRVSVLAHFLQQSLRFQIFDNFLSRSEAIESSVHASIRVHMTVAGHHLNFRQLMAPSGFKVIRIVRWRDLYRAGSKLAVHHLVGNDRDLTVHQRQKQILADQVLIPLVLGMHCNRGITQHRFRSRRRHHYKFIAVGHRILDVPQIPLPLLMQHFQVAQHCQTNGTPVDQPRFAVNQAFVVQPHKHFPHHPRHLRRKRKSLSRPVAALPNALHLLGDLVAGFFFPFPNLLFEFRAPELLIVNALIHQVLHNHSLRGDSRMVGARQIQGVVPPHPEPASQNIDLGVLQHVANVQRTSHVWRWDDDRENWTERIHFGAKQIVLHPKFRPAWFNLLWVVGLRDLPGHA